MNTKHGIPVLESAIKVLGALSEGKVRTSSVALSKHVGISQSTCYRILQTLESANWIRRREGKGYELSFGLLPIIEPMLEYRRIATELRGVLDIFANQVQLTTKVSIRSDLEHITVASAEPIRQTGVSNPVGAHFPIITGAAGASLLCKLQESELTILFKRIPQSKWHYETPELVRARIQEYRENGYIVNLDVQPYGFDTMSTPIECAEFDMSLSVTGIRGDINKENLKSLGKSLKTAAQRIKERLEQ